MDFIVFIPILFFSVVLHEFAHGITAYKLGDDTAYLSGRLTLNPLPHIDPVGTIVVPAICYFTGMPLFGWAKPVPVNPMRFTSPRSGMGKVALAGPAMNLLLALLVVILMKLMLVSGWVGGETMQRSFVFLNYAVLINVMLAIFNLMPIPPLDGGNIVSSFLPYTAAVRYEGFFGRYGMYIVIGLILTGLFKYILVPPALFVLSLLNKFLMM